MPRNRNGYLKRDALRMGVPEQYATIIGGVAHSVEIIHDRARGGLVTRVRHGDEVHEWQFGDDLASARDRFRIEARALGGRV